MARKRGQRPTYLTRAESHGSRSWLREVWLPVGIVACIGFPLLRDATADPMQRNRYADERSCRCDYGDRCRLEDGQWTGPWYARDRGDQWGGDPGAGACRSGGGSRYGYGGSRTTPAEDAYRGPASVERGYRGGFGGSGRVRAASS